MIESRKKILKYKNIVNQLSMITQLGIIMIVPIFFCLFIGEFIDKFTKCSPLFTIIFIVLGVAAAFRNLFYYGLKQAKHNEHNTSKAREDKDDE